ncbi:MAG: amidohydrolase family protein [Alphaproteobacteria bacterium]
MSAAKETMSGAIDIVCNPFTARELDLGQTGFGPEFMDQVRMPDEMRRGISLESYIEKMDRAGIARSLLIAVRAGDIRMKGSVEIPYAQVAEYCRAFPDRFSGLAGVDPYRGMDGVRELEEAVTEFGFVGAHLYPHWFGLAPDHAKYYPYYAKCCELGIPIMMQVGQNLVYNPERPLPSVGRPICLDQVAIDFPDLKLLGIHIGVPWTDEMIAMAWKHRNVYIGVDAYAPKYWPEALVHYLNTYGQDKVLFGTDWPVIDPERAVEEIAAMNIREQPLRKLMRENALKVFDLPGSRAKTARAAE